MTASTTRERGVFLLGQVDQARRVVFYTSGENVSSEDEHRGECGGARMLGLVPFVIEPQAGDAGLGGRFLSGKAARVDKRRKHEVMERVHCQSGIPYGPQLVR